jgi:hypothetical protein
MATLHRYCVYLYGHNLCLVCGFPWHRAATTPARPLDRGGAT